MTSPSLNAPPTTAQSQAPPPPKDTAQWVDKTRKRDAIEVPKAATAKKLKNIIADDLPSAIVASTFGSLAIEYFFKGDVKLLKGRDNDEGEVIFRASLGEAFYNGLMTISRKNNMIKEQDRSLRKLKGKVYTFNTKLSDAQKKAVEEAKAREGEIARLTAAIEEAKTESAKTAELHKGEIVCPVINNSTNTIVKM